MTEEYEFVVKVNNIEKPINNGELDISFNKINEATITFPLGTDVGINDEIDVYVNDKLDFEGIVTKLTTKRDSIVINCRELAEELEKIPALPGFRYMRIIYIDKVAGLVMKDYQQYVYIQHLSNMNNDFSDVRFGDANQNLYSYYLQDKNDGSDALFWVKIPEITSESPFELYMYYGNEFALSESNISDTFMNYIDTSEYSNADDLFDLEGDATHNMVSGEYHLSSTGDEAFALLKSIDPSVSDEHINIAVDFYMRFAGSDPVNGGIMSKFIKDKPTIGFTKYYYYVYLPGFYDGLGGSKAYILRRTKGDEVVLNEQGGEGLTTPIHLGLGIFQTPNETNNLVALKRNVFTMNATEFDDGGIIEGRPGLYTEGDCEVYVSNIRVRKYNPGIVPWDFVTGNISNQFEISLGKLKYNFTFVNVDTYDIVDYVKPSNWSIGEFENKTMSELSVNNESVLFVLQKIAREYMELELYFGPGKTINMQDHRDVTIPDPVIDVKYDNQVDNVYDATDICDGVIVVGKDDIYGSKGDLSGKVLFVNDDKLKTIDECEALAGRILLKKSIPEHKRDVVTRLNHMLDGSVINIDEVK